MRRRGVLLDVVVAVLLTAAAQGEMWWYDGGPQGVPAVTTASAAVFTGLLVLRTSRTELMVVAASVVVLTQAMLGGRLTSTLSVAFASMLMMLTAGLRLDRLRSVWVALLFLASTWLDLLVIEHDDFGVVSDLAFTTVVAVGVPFLAGYVLRDRRLREEDLVSLNRQLEDERRRTAAMAASEERTRIARDMHDVVAHSVSLMVVQAGAARRVLDQDTDQARAALLTVEEVGREALHDLRRALGLLRDPDAGPSLAPAPDLSGLDALVARTRAAGLDMHVEAEGVARQLAPGADVTAFRIIQEAVTNVLRHARAHRAEIRVRWLETALVLEVVDDGVGGATSGTGGLGITGMRERAALFGGTVTAGPRDQGGFGVTVMLPYAGEPAALEHQA